MVHAGLSQLSVLSNHTGTFWEKEETLHSLNNNSLIVLEISTTTDAAEVSHLMPFNTSDMSEVSNQI